MISMKTKMGHTAVSDIESSSVTLRTEENFVFFLQNSRRKDQTETKHFTSVSVENKSKPNDNFW